MNELLILQQPNRVFFFSILITELNQCYRFDLSNTCNAFKDSCLNHLSVIS